MNQQDFTDCCRVCSQRGQGMIPIFPSFVLAQKFICVSQLKVFEGDGLPDQICHGCISRLDDAYQFKQLCIHSEELFRKSAFEASNGTDNFSSSGNLKNSKVTFMKEAISDSQAEKETTGSFPLNSRELYHHPIEVKVEIQGDDYQAISEEPPFSTNCQNNCGELQLESQMAEPSSVNRGEFSSNGLVNKESNSLKDTSASKTYSCEICIVSFKKKTAFISHMKLHMTDDIDEVMDGSSNFIISAADSFTDQYPFLCCICGGSYRYRDSFIAHMRLHDFKSNGTTHFQRSFVNELSNIPHKAKEQSYSCAICHAKFRIKQGLMAHVHQYHEREPPENEAQNSSLVIKKEPSPFTCAVCNVSFEEQSDFTTHLSEHSMETDQEISSLESDAVQCETDKEFTCAICKAVYKNRQGFISHIKLHTVEKKFECSDCEKRFTSHSDLTRHFRCHTGEKPFQCVVCEKSFSRQDHLAKHVRTHTGYKPFTCGECNLSFAEKRTLASHLRSHRGEKPYECPTCHKMFARQMNFTVHVRSHTGSKPFKCSTCDKNFSERRGLARHVRLHHEATGLGGT